MIAAIRRHTPALAATLLGTVALALPATAAVTWELPSRDQVMRLITLRDHNTRVVLLGAAALGPACGLLGTFMLLRKRALLSDALSHATLPGIGLAFILMATLAGSGKYLPGLLIGAMIFGLLGVGAVLLIRTQTRLKEDAALAVVLSVFFGFGLSVLGIVQQMQTGSAAGLTSFIYGKAASMVQSDATLIAVAAGIIVLLSLLLHKEFKLLCFDADFAGAQGWPTLLLDAALMTLVTAVTVIGLQAVGLILIVALLVIPPAAARFWTERLSRMLIIAALIGLVSCTLGVAISALGPDLPTGPFIVLVASACFGLSMIFGSSRGVVVRLLRRTALERNVARQNLLRAMYELSESRAHDDEVSFDALLAKRSWSPRLFERTIRSAQRDGLIEHRDARLRLTGDGTREAYRVVRNHRLWELFLIHYADVAPSQVDRGADYVEHVLDADTMAELDALLRRDHPDLAMPASPHPLEAQA